MGKKMLVREAEEGLRIAQLRRQRSTPSSRSSRTPRPHRHDARRVPAPGASRTGRRTAGTRSSRGRRAALSRDLKTTKLPGTGARADRTRARHLKRRPVHTPRNSRRHPPRDTRRSPDPSGTRCTSARAPTAPQLFQSHGGRRRKVDRGPDVYGSRRSRNAPPCSFEGASRH